MVASLNKVTLIGNLGADPEIRRLNSGDQMANFRIATTDSWRDRNTGEPKQHTEWHNIVIYNENLVKIVEQYLKKGSGVYVEGKLQNRKWQDQNGNDRYTTEVVLSKFDGRVIILNSNKTENNADDNSSSTDANGIGRNYAAQKGKEVEDDVPF